MRIYILVLVFTFTSCNTEKVADKILIKQVLNEQTVAWNSGDIKGYMAGYLQSDSLRFASGRNVSYGWETTLNRYKKGYPDKSAMGKLTFSNIDIKIISGKSALVFGRWELKREADHPRGLFTLLFNKTDAGWRIVHDHTSSAGN